jgi:hypothetical protein
MFIQIPWRYRCCSELRTGASAVVLLIVETMAKHDEEEACERR